MPDNSVTTTFFADEKQATAALARLEKKYNDLEHAVKHMHAAGKHGHGEFLHHAAEMTTAFGGMLLGFRGIEGGVEKVIELTREWRKETDAAALSLDKSSREFQIRAGEFGPKGKEAFEKVHAGADAAAISHGDAEQLYGDLKRKGFDSEAILKDFASIAASFKVNRSVSGVDTQGFADAIVKGMDRTGQKTAGALSAGARGLYNLTAGTEATAGDVSEMAKILASLKGGKGEQRHAAGLARMGLKFGDVDQIGEDLPTALGRMSAGLGRVKPEERMGVLKNVVGDADLARKMLAALESMAANDKNYAKATKIATTGLAAGKQRLAGMKHEQAAEAGGDWDLQIEAAELVARARGQNNIIVGINKHAADVMKDFGAPDASAIASTFGATSGTGAVEFAKQFSEMVSLLKQGVDKQAEVAELLEQIKTERKGKPARKAAE